MIRILTVMILKVARNTRDYSHSLRQEAKQLRIDADAKTKWFNYENNVKLNERVRNITEWRDKLDQCLRDLNLEISVQKDAKEACERALEAKVFILVCLVLITDWNICSESAAGNCTGKSECPRGQTGV